jgi:hypothetical protein
LLRREWPLLPRLSVRQGQPPPLCIALCGFVFTFLFLLHGYKAGIDNLAFRDAPHIFKDMPYYAVSTPSSRFTA